MTLSEFKAWFEGFSEGIDKAPTEKQFAKIKAKVADINGVAVTYPVYIDRYVPHWPAYYHPWVSVGGAGVGISTVGAIWQNGSYAGTMMGYAGNSQTQAFDSHAAMNALGRAEAMN